MASAADVNVVYDFIEDPERAAELVKSDPPVVLGFAAYLLAAMSMFLAEGLTGRLGVLGTSLVSMSLMLIWHLGMGIVQTALVHLVVEACGGKGKAVSLFVLLGFSELAWALVLPGALVVQAFFGGSAIAVSIVFLLVGTVALLLKVRSVRDNYGVGSGEAWFAVLFPYLAVAAATMFVLFVAIWGIAQALMGLIS